MAAYKGTTVHGFPNLFMIVGPNTGLGHSSMVFIIESQVAYLRDAVRTMRAARLRRRRAAPRTRQRRWNADLQRRMKRTVWNTGGCSSWYLDDHGRNTIALAAHDVHVPPPARAFDADGVRRRTARPHRPDREEVDRMKTLDDKVVVITGAGSGIGRALAVDLARRGALLALSDVDEAGLAETVDLVKTAGAREVRSDRLDVADRAAFAAYAAAVAEQFGRVNVVVNNAGVALAGDLEDLDVRRHGLDHRHQLLGRRPRHQGVPAAPDRLRRRARGEHLVAVRAGLDARPERCTTPTKYAVRGLTEALREEMLIAGHPVGVTAVHPGGIKTAIARNARVSDQRGQGGDREALRREAGAG